MEKVKTAKLQTLRRDFESLDMKELDTIDSFFTQLLRLVNQIRFHGETLEEERVVEKKLICLPPRFDSIVVAIEESKDLSQISIDEIHSSLISHEHRLNGRTHTSLEHAFRHKFQSDMVDIREEQILEVEEETQIEVEEVCH